MNLQALEVFCEVVRQQSFSRGASTLGITQSAASQLVAHLEDELGFLLINRKNRPLKTTPEGRLYYQGCQELLHRHRSVLEEIRHLRQGLAGTVRVASIYSAGLHTLSRYIQKFMSENTGSTVRLEYFHPSKVYSAVLNDDADLGVISYPKPHRELRTLAWLEEEMVLACPVDHPLAHRGKLRLEDLRDISFVSFDPDLQIRREIDRTLKSHHVTVRVLSEFDNIETIKQALEISSAVSILPRPSIEREVQKGTLVELPLDGIDLRRPVGIIHRRKKELTPTAEQFVASLLNRAPSKSDWTARAPGERPRRRRRTG